MKNEQKQESVFKEAWNNMSRDMSRILPPKLQMRKDKKKFFILFAILELVVLGIVGKFIYDWLTG